MPGASRKGDVCTGHGKWYPRPCIDGSPDVFINGKPAAVYGGRYASHIDHDGYVSSASPNVFINGKGGAREGDLINCGSRVGKGSPDVMVNG